MKRWNALAGVAVAAALVIAPLVSAGASATGPEPLVGEVGTITPWTPDTNKASYWEKLFEAQGADCESYSGDSAAGTLTDGGKTITLSTPPAGTHWEVLIVKAGSVSNNVIVHPKVGVAYASPANSGGQQAAVSHWLVCTSTTSHNPYGPVPPVFTPPSCDSPGAFLFTDTPQYTYSVTTVEGTKLLITATPTGGGTAQSWGPFEAAQLTGEECDDDETVVNDCTEGVGFYSSDLDDRWLNVDTRPKGHIAYVAGGLHVWTDDNSSDAKVSEGIAVDFPLHDTGVLAINATANPGNDYPYGPGLNLFVDFDGNGTIDGTLVYETVYGQDLWLTNGSAAFVKAAAPSHTGGNGSDNHGTIDQWLSEFPAAQVKGLAYSLGSGVHGDWTITSIVANCAEYTFGTSPTTPVPTVFSADPIAPSCNTAGALPELNAEDFPNVTLAFNRSFDGPGAYTLTGTAKPGFTFPDGSTVKTKTFEVEPATHVYQDEDPEVECFAELLPGEIVSQCVGSVPYLAYNLDLPQEFVVDSATPVTITFVHPTDPSQNYVVTNQPLSGTLLWPGASAATPQQWPGWVLNSDGTYSETDGNFAWTRAAAGITVRFEVNPTYETTVVYPAESALCANPASDPGTPSALPATGGVDMTPWGIGAALMLLAGAALLATRRLARR